MRRRSGFREYLKAAFYWRWNLLAFGAGIAFALLSGKPDVLLPLVAAGEILYLGLLSTRPRFQKAIDARTLARTQPVQDDAELVKRIRGQLNSRAWARFEELRDRCQALSRLAEQVRGPHSGDSARAQEMQKESLERMLWMFLKLLYSHDALQRFLESTDRALLDRQLAEAEQGIKEAAAAQRSEKLLRSLQDKLDTVRQRIANFDRADENRELLAAEIDRIEQKVNVISEMSISTRDAADISAQVDGIAEGVSATEEAIRRLDVPPLFERESAPRLLGTLEMK